MLDRDDDGYFVNRCSRMYLRSPWSELVEEGVAAVRQHFRDTLHSVYLRGSVAEGTAILGLADVDLLAILGRHLTAGDRAWKEDTQARFRMRTPFVSEVEFDLVPYRILSDRENGVLWQFALATQSVCLAGQNVIPDLPRFRPTRDLATRLVQGTRQHVRGAHGRLEEAAEPAAVQRICRRSAKYLLRAAANLLIEEEGFTRDLRESAGIVVRNHPDRATDVAMALRLALTPPQDPAEVRAFLEGFGRWVCDEVDRVVHDRR